MKNKPSGEMPVPLTDAESEAAPALARTVALEAPSSVGANSTSTMQLAPAASALPLHASTPRTNWLASAPVISIVTTLELAPPLFITVKLVGSLRTPRASDPKSWFSGLIDSPAVPIGPSIVPGLSGVEPP